MVGLGQVYCIKILNKPKKSNMAVVGYVTMEQEIMNQDVNLGNLAICDPFQSLLHQPQMI